MHAERSTPLLQTLKGRLLGLGGIVLSVLVIGNIFAVKILNDIAALGEEAAFSGEVQMMAQRGQVLVTAFTIVGATLILVLTFFVTHSIVSFLRRWSEIPLRTVIAANRGLDEMRGVAPEAAILAVREPLQELEEAALQLQAVISGSNTRTKSAP